MVNRRNDRKPAKIRVTPRRAADVTEYRKAELSTDVDNGIISEGTSYAGSRLNRSNPTVENAPLDSDRLNRGAWLSSGDKTITETRKKVSLINGGASKTAVGAVAHSDTYLKTAAAEAARELQKTAASVGSVGGTAGTSAGSTVERLAPEVYSPLFTMANLNLPRDRITINAWCRNFFLLHPIVRNAITLHATYPISKLNIKCQDKRVLQFHEDMIEEMDLMGALGDISLEYWKLGECFPYAELDEERGKWSKIVVQNPDYVHVKKTVLSGDPIISLKPDAVLQRLVMSNNPADMRLRRQIPEKIIYHVRARQDIPLDNFNVSHLKLLSSPYDVRGTSIIVSAFKDLMLYDKIRESKFAQADSMINPITLIKVGGNEDGDYRATQEDLEFFREIFEEAEYDKNFKLITHAGVKVERVGYTGQVLEISGDMELIIKNIYTGLMVPPAVVDTESAVYASASIGLEVLRQRYFNFRNMMAKWLVNKIFAPISEIQGFYEYKNKEKRLIVPEVEWNHMNLYDLQDYISNITGMVSSKQASVQTLYRSMGLNYEDEKIKMRQESIDEAIRRREEMALGTMTLTELRSLDPEKPIMEAIDSREREAEPAVPPEAGMPAGVMPPGAEMGAGPLGGLPELAPPPGGALETPPGAGAPPGAGVTPPLGPGTPGGAGGPGGLGV